MAVFREFQPGNPVSSACMFGATGRMGQLSASGFSRCLLLFWEVWQRSLIGTVTNELVPGQFLEVLMSEFYHTGASYHAHETILLDIGSAIANTLYITENTKQRKLFRDIATRNWS